MEDHALPPSLVLSTTIDWVQIKEPEEVHLSKNTMTMEIVETTTGKENLNYWAPKNFDIPGQELNVPRKHDSLFQENERAGIQRLMVGIY